jgi:Domain of unknown function (DUF4123)
MAQPHLNQVLDLLWPDDLPLRTRVFAVLDNARDERIYDALEDCVLPKGCLFAGNVAFSLLRAAPFLVELRRESSFTRLLIREGWGNSWGVFLRSGAGFEEVRHHVRHFLRAKDESGRKMLFRWYDPRVLRVYLPTCEPHELEFFFGPIERFIMEGESPEDLLQFRRDGGALRRLRQILSSAGTTPPL